MDTDLRSGLVEVPADFPTFASAGLERRAEEIGQIAASSFEYLAGIRLGEFFDLVAVHEVAHLFTERVAGFPRLWLGEFFANACLHGWVERRSPDYFRAAVVKPNERMTEAIELLESKRDADGRWPVEHKYEGDYHFDMDDAEGQPSRWNTLRASRVPRWWEAARGSVQTYAK